MNFDLDMIQKMWEQDSKIDIDNLHTESLNIPALHAKYFDIYNNIFLLKKKAEQQRRNIRHERYEYYTGKLDEETLKEKGWEPFQLRVLKNDVDMYLEGDKDVNKLKGRIQLQEERVEYIEATVKNIANRGWLIRNAIDWKKFLGGV